MQLVGVGFVFGGIGAEGVIVRREKAQKAAAKKAELNGNTKVAAKKEL
jgi:UDP-galactose transporter B1